MKRGNSERIWFWGLAWLLAGMPLGGRGESGAFDLEPLVVTGTRTLHRLDETPIRTELVSLGGSEGRASCTLADAVEGLPGVRVENNCQNCGTSDILLLGLKGKYTTVLLDGQRLYSGLAGVYGLEQIPSIFLDRIEVVKGAGSAVYGSGAIGGVVNLIGHRPLESGGFLEYRRESVHGEPGTQVSLLLNHVGEGRGTSLSVYAMEAEQSPVDLNKDGFSDLTKRDLEVTGLRWARQFNQGHLRIDANWTTEYRRGGDRFALPDNLANISERVDTERGSGSITWTGQLNADTGYSLSGGFAFIDRETFYGGLFGNAADAPLSDNEQAFIDRGYSTYGEVALDQFGFTENRVYSAELQMDHRWNGHETILGLQYYQEEIEDIVPVSSFVQEYPVPAERADGTVVGVFLQDVWQLGEPFELLLGLRADLDSVLQDWILSPRLGMRYAAGDDLILRATAGTGFRAPQPFDEDLHIELIAGERATTRQAEDLKEEQAHSAMVSLVWSPAVFEGKLTTETSVFYTHIEGTFTNSEIRTDAANGEAFRERFNGPDAEVGGVEINIGTEPLENLRIDVGYVIQFARFTEPVVLLAADDGTLIREEDFTETPRQYGVLRMSLATEILGDVSFSATYTGSMKVLNERTGVLNPGTERFLVFDFTIVRELSFNNLPKMTLAAGIRNITDDRQNDLESGVDRDPYYLYGPRTPRTFFASLRLAF